MQKINLMGLSFLLLVLSGCAAPDGCPVVDAFTNLDARNANPNSNYNAGTGATTISVRPDTIRVRNGCHLVIRNNDNHTITTDGAESWLDGGPVDNDLRLGPAKCATDPCTEADIFKFKIIVDGIGELDPRARVR